MKRNGCNRNESVHMERKAIENQKRMTDRSGINPFIWQILQILTEQ